VSDDPVRLAMLGRLVRRRWRLLAALAVLGALLGAAAYPLLSPGYRTSTNVLLQGPREPDVLLTEAQVAQSTVVLDRAATALGWHVSGAQLQAAVHAAVAEGNVIRITGTASTPERAQQLADRVAQEYVRFSTQLVSDTADASAQVAREQRETLRQQIAQTNERISQLHASVATGLTVESVQARTELEGLRSTLAQAMNKLDAADVASADTKMAVMGQAERPAGPAAPTLPQLVFGTALLFVVCGVLGLFIAARSDRRLRDETQIATALGADVLTSVDVLVSSQAPARGAAAGSGAAGGGPLAWLDRLRELVWDGQPWDVPRVQASGDAASRRVRYRRLLERLGTGHSGSGHPGTGHSGSGPGALLLVVADGDAAGRAAADELAAIAAGVKTPAEVVTVAPDRPTAPDAASSRSAVLVVLGPGTRTGGELVAIAEACADAGHRVLGAVLAHPTRPASAGRRRSVAGSPDVSESAAGDAGAPDGTGIAPGPGAAGHQGNPGPADHPGVLAGKP
jgi:capsular polysaccharide biosynthesis protein